MIGELKYINEQWTVTRIINLGPNCTQTTRILVDHSSIKDYFEEGKKVYYEIDDGKAKIIFQTNESFEPTISDNFQIGPNGAYEHEDKSEDWNYVFSILNSDLHADLPLRVQNWLKNSYQLKKLSK